MINAIGEKGRSSLATSRQKKRRKIQEKNKKWFVLGAMGLTALLGFSFWLGTLFGQAPANISGAEFPEWIDQQLIQINGHARRGEKLGKVKNIVEHYVANPGTSAQQNRDYFNNDDTTVSAHFLVGLEGEVIQCVPLDEKSSATNDRNGDTISIEVCHPDKTGKFNNKTYRSLVKLTAWLLQQKGLTPDHVIRHFDCDGKYCPLYYVEHEDAWNKLKQDIADYYYANPNIQ